MYRLWSLAIASSHVFISCLALLAFHGVLSPQAAAGGLSPAETRGKQIYVEGTSSAGRPITAHVGRDGVPVPAVALPCINCHGADGRGVPEGGVIPSDITWSRLSKPYGGVAARGRRHPAYTEDTFMVAVAGGVDPAGNRLEVSMPRYAMAREDLLDLAAYVKRLERDLDPGLSDDRIAIGTVLPRAGAMTPVAEAIAAVLSAYFADVNSKDGIYGRKIELIVAYADTPVDAMAKARRLASGEVFALVGALIAGVDRAFAELVEERKVPLIGPFTADTPDETDLLHYTFYLLPGARLQGFALIDFAATRIPDVGLPVAIVHPDGEAAAALAESMRTHARDQGWWRVRLESYAPEAMNPVALAGKLHDTGTQVMFFLGSGADFKALAQAVDRVGWAPFTFLQGVRTSREVFDTPERFAGRLFIAYPTSPQDQTPAARREFNAFRQRHGLPAQHAAVQMTAYAGAQLLVHGLKASGRTLTREKLVKTLEALYRYETGLIPPLTFGPNRRVGVHGAQIVAVDLANRRFLPGATWVEIK